MTFLLDANILIALIDPQHAHHFMAQRWFAEDGRASWATCPLTEIAVLRIVGNPRYPGSPGSPAETAVFLADLLSKGNHEFWPDDVRLLASAHCDIDRIRSWRQVTDTYLLSLAVAHGGKLATFDRRLVTDAVKGGRQALHVIEP